MPALFLFIKGGFYEMEKRRPGAWVSCNCRVSY